MKSVEELRAEYNNLSRRSMVGSGKSESESAEAVPPLGDADGGPATPDELVWFREKHAGRPVIEADGEIRCRRQWLPHLTEADARYLGYISG